MKATTMDKSGHTLVELMMVIGIIGITAAAAVPAFMENLPQHRMNQAAWQIYMDLEQAKARAVSQNVPVVIQVNNNLDQYSLWVDSNENGAQDDGETTVTSLQNIPGVDLYAYPTSGTFSPTGTLKTSSYYMYFRIYSSNGRYKYVYVFPNGHIDAYRIHEKI